MTDTQNDNIDPMLLGFKMAVDAAVSRLRELDEELEQGSAASGRRAINREAIATVGDVPEVTNGLISQVRELSGSDPQKILGLMLTVQKAIEDAFKTQVDAYVEKALADQPDRGPGLSDEDRTAKVTEYQERYNYLENLVNILDHTPNGEQVKAFIPFKEGKDGANVLAFRKRKASSGERAPQGPRLPKGSVWTFTSNGSSLGKNFPAVAENLKVDALTLKKAMAKSNGVDDPDDNEKLTKYFRSLDRVNRVDFQVTDGQDNVRTITALREAPSEDEGEDASDDENGDELEV